MHRSTLQRFFPLAGAVSGLSRFGRAPSNNTARPRQEDIECNNLPQSQPMQRSINQQLLPDSDSEYDSSPTTESSNDDILSPCAIEPPGSDERRVQLQEPLDPYDDALIWAAELICDALIVDEDEEIFTPSPDLPGLGSYDYTDEECTVLAVHSLLKKSTLPLATFVLAALIIRKLGPRFYLKWFDHMFEDERYYDERSREVIVISAIVVAQKYLHDAIYLLSTWSNMVCEYRGDIHQDTLRLTERLIVDHLDWNFRAIANEDEINALVDEVVDGADKPVASRYEKYLMVY